MNNFSDADKVATAALVNARVAEAVITAMGYVAENEQRKVLGHSMAYTSDH